jgi:hypothetical protein
VNRLTTLFINRDFKHVYKARGVVSLGSHRTLVHLLQEISSVAIGVVVANVKE